jgi:hypothetical protein
LDGRSAEARRTKTVLKKMVEDLGGEAGLSGAQRLVLTQLSEKIATVHVLATHIRAQAVLIGEDGELIPALRRSYLAYSNSVRRDVEVLFQLRERPSKKAPNLAAFLKQRGNGG